MSDHDNEVAVEGEDEGHPAGDKSILDLLRADYKDVADNKEVYLPIVGWERTGLAIRYHLPSGGKELDAVARKVQLQFNRNQKYERGFFTAMDTMIRLCDGLYFKHPEDPTIWVELDPEETGMPLDLGDGDELSSIFGWNGAVSSARDVVRKLFGDNEIAILNHCEKLQRWMVDSKADLDTEIWELPSQ